MRRLSKRLSLPVLPFVILSFILIMLTIILSGCYSDPAEVGTWYLGYIMRGEERYSCNDEFDGELLFTDSWIWTFTEDGKVEIAALDGTKISGTYTAEKKKTDRSSLYVTVTLDNGEEYTGFCGRFMFDGTWYEFSLTNGDITIYFDDVYDEYFSYQNYLDRSAEEEEQ